MASGSGGASDASAIALCALAFAPPVHGQTLLIPIDGTPIPTSTLEALLLTPLNNGPVAGSLVVEGKGREHAAGLLGQGIIMLAAPAALCGGAEARGSEAS